MTTSDYLDSKTITIKDLEKNFVEVARYDTSDSAKDACPHCKDNCNQYSKPSEPWTSVTQCISCDSIILTVHGDAMGGTGGNSHFVFQDKERRAYTKYWKCPTGGPFGGPYTNAGYNAILCLACNHESKDPERIKDLHCEKCNKSMDYNINAKFLKT